MASAPSFVPDLDLATLGGQTMGTTWSVKLCIAPRTDLQRLHAGIQHQLDEVVAQMSTWRHDSDISLYNAAAAGSWHALPAPFDRVLRCAMEIAQASGGAFDPTLGALVGAWGFGAQGQGFAVPSESSIAQARRHAGWRRLQWRHNAKSELLQPGGLQLDLSAIAKGFGVDHVAHWLRARGVLGALVEVGGELFGWGLRPDGGRWQVLVETACELDAVTEPCVLTLDGQAVATSGDHWHHFERDGARHGHTLDAHSGRPVSQAAAAVTVLAASAMEADAWATALTVMGAEAGLAFADARGMAARFVMRTATGPCIRTSAAFDAPFTACP
ncbi:MAG: FAD:protein FMN transferase [Pseudoxanthomonas sp.]